MKKFIYVGVGDGVPGLPSEISDEQAKAEGLTDLLNDAVNAGVYVEKKAVNEKTAKSDKKELSNG